MDDILRTFANQRADDIHRGSALLTARTILHHPRYVHDRFPSIIFDAKVPCFSSHQESFLCSLRYNLNFPRQSVQPGAYDIVAKVCAQYFF